MSDSYERVARDATAAIDSALTGLLAVALSSGGDQQKSADAMTKWMTDLTGTSAALKARLSNLDAGKVVEMGGRDG